VEGGYFSLSAFEESRCAGRTTRQCQAALGKKFSKRPRAAARLSIKKRKAGEQGAKGKGQKAKRQNRKAEKLKL